MYSIDRFSNAEISYKLRKLNGYKGLDLFCVTFSLGYAFYDFYLNGLTLCAFIALSIVYMAVRNIGHIRLLSAILSDELKYREELKQKADKELFEDGIL